MTEDTAQPEKQGAGTDSKLQPPLDRDLVFYYSRAHRLERASQAVRNMNQDIPKTSPTLFGTLTANRSHAVLLIAILVCSVLIMIIFKVSPNKRASPESGYTARLGGNTLWASVKRFEGTTYLTIKKTAAKDTAVYTGTVDMVITLLEAPGSGAEAAEMPLVVRHQIVFSSRGEEEFGLSLPADASQVLLFMQTSADDSIGDYISIPMKPE
ncbi:MAG: hypothetical protein LBQ30_06910 [Treponema sp.]|jgi:hypothetical protein|nr:hypothetical protein [Treponema sp.]